MTNNFQLDANPAQHFLDHQVRLSGPDGQALDIPVGGAIGLLALGDIGTIAWRQKIQQVKTGLAQRTQAHLAQDGTADFLTPKIADNGKA